MSETNSERNDFLKHANQDTLFMFPERCSMGVIESRLRSTALPVRFSTLDIELDPDDEDQFESIFHLIRKSNAVRLTHMPNPFQSEEVQAGSSIVISFHEDNETVRDWDSPLVAAVISMNENSVMKDLERFNEHVIRLESLGLSVDFGEEITVLMLLELQAVGESLFETFPQRLGNFLFTPVYYAEFQPRLREPLEPLLHALGHQRASKPAVHGENSVDLTGLLPEGLA
ncbi:MAG TPA: hypothetical protein PLV45_04845 [bacterium]|nr:hypothetical protein [bacterium]